MNMTAVVGILTSYHSSTPTQSLTLLSELPRKNIKLPGEMPNLVMIMHIICSI